jgi:hypothetical protein
LALQNITSWKERSEYFRQREGVIAGQVESLMARSKISELTNITVVEGRNVKKKPPSENFTKSK